MKKQKTDWEKVKEQYKDWCFYNKQHLGRMFDSEAFWDFYLKQTLQQQREEIVSEIEGIVIGKLENFRASKLITSDILDKVLKVGETDWNIQIDENNRRLDELEKEIREGLKQI